MTIPEEIEQLKIKLKNTADEREQAEVLVEMLGKYSSLQSTDTQVIIERLMHLAEKLNETVYKAWALHFGAWQYRLKGAYSLSIEASRQALSLFKQHKEIKGMADCHQNIGNVYQLQGQYVEALYSYFNSLNLKEQINDKNSSAATYNNIAIVYETQGNYLQALKTHFTALKLKQELGDKNGVANSYNNLGLVYEAQGNYQDALKNYFAALKLKEELDDQYGIACALNNIGNIYLAQRSYPEALKTHFASLALFEKIGDQIRTGDGYIGIGNIYEKQGNYAKALEYHLASLKLKEEVGDKYGITICYVNIGNIYGAKGNYPSAMENLISAISVAQETGNKELIKETYLSLSNVFKIVNDFENALKYHEKYHQVESEILGQEAQKQLTNLNFQHNMEQKEKQLEIEQLRNVELKKEKDRSEALLLNILPSEVAEELKNKGSADAKLFDDVTVLFTDFKSFTTVSERLSPQELVDELNTCFSAFDEIMGRYNIEKIKTVGDAYLAVSGLPLSNRSHASDVVNAAVEIRTFIKERKQRIGDKTFDIRIGVHSGSVVAGIVGVKKFAYDIWGDTVNTAARMEQNSKAGKINISEATYQLVRNSFNCKYRGEIEVKNKGKMKMYFVQ
jgi:adenylate cyclase